MYKNLSGYKGKNKFKAYLYTIEMSTRYRMQNDLSATEQEEFRIRCRSALDGLETLLQSLLEISKICLLYTSRCV